MQLHKIKQYNVIALSKILVFRVGYKLICELDRISSNNKYSDRGGYCADIQSVTASCSNYYGFVNSDGQDVINAERVMNGYIPLFGKDFSFNYKTDWLKDPVTGNSWPNVFWSKARFIKEDCADVKYVLELNKLNHLVTLAQAYYSSKDEKFVRRIDEELKAWVKCVPPEMSVANKIVMDLGFRAINLVHISLLCADSDYFKENVHPLVLGILVQHKRQLWRFLSSRWFKSGNDNNHNIGEIVGLYVTQTWLKQFGIHTSERVINKELPYLKKDLDKLIASSGAYLEMSSNYTRVVHDFLLMFELFRHSFDYNRDFKAFEKNEYFERLSDYLINLSYAGKLPNFGDNDYAQVVLPFNRQDDVVAHVRIHHKNSGPVKNYADASQWLYRSKDDYKVFLFTRAGKFAHFVEGAFAHSHNDILSFLAGVKGHELFIDKGCLFYNSGMDTRKEFSSTLSHNTVTVDDLEMTNYLPVGYSDYPWSRIIDSKQGDDACSFVAELKYKGIEHIRSVRYESGQIDITDKVKVEGHGHTARISYLLAEDNVPEITSSNSISLALPNGQSLCNVVIQGVDTIEIIDTDYAPHYGLRKQTKQIIGSASMDESLEIKTIIKL